MLFILLISPRVNLAGKPNKQTFCRGKTYISFIMHSYTGKTIDVSTSSCIQVAWPWSAHLFYGVCTIHSTLMGLWTNHTSAFEILHYLHIYLQIFNGSYEQWSYLLAAWLEYQISSLQLWNFVMLQQTYCLIFHVMLNANTLLKRDHNTSLLYLFTKGIASRKS